MEKKSFLSRLYDSIFDDKNESVSSHAYNWFMMIVIIVSIVPLAFKRNLPLFYWIDKITVIIFILDYILRFITANEKYKEGVVSFIKYPFSFMAIIDIISILPSFTPLASGWRIFKLFRLLRTLKVFRVFKIIRYSKSIEIILNVIKKQKNALVTVGGFAIGYILVTALIVFNVEPNTFNSFFDAVYWATVSLTTVGYGDIYPVTVAGRMFTMLSNFVGIAVVALPSGIITAGFMKELHKEDE